MLGRRKQTNLANNEKKNKKQWQLELESQTEENSALNRRSKHTKDDDSSREDNYLRLSEEDIDNPKDSILVSESLEPHTSTENTSDKDINISLENIETATDVGNRAKRKRFEWMDSDDEDIGSSSEDEDNSDDIEIAHNPEKAKSPSRVNEDLQTTTTLHSTETANNNEVIDPDEMKYVYVSNVSWDATTKELLRFIEKQSGQQVVAIHTEFLLASGTISNFKTSSIGRHKGRVIIELKTYQSLPDVLKLNEQPFMGRPLRITKAYKKEGLYHFGTKFFSSRNMLNTSSAYKSNKKAKVDGGFNWAS